MTPESSNGPTPGQTVTNNLDADSVTAAHGAVEARPTGPPLFDEHRRELLGESAVDPAVVAERGYRTIGRPTANDERPREELRRLGIPTWSTSENRFFPGLLIPLYRPGGERISAQWKPRVPVPNRDGKPMKYASAKGRPSVLDVHPRNRDRIIDPTVPLWITEGVKKADALTSRGACVVALSGVFNWRSPLGTLGDWEDVTLRGRQVIVCFDADARHNPNVMRAMQRLGKWLKSKQAKTVLYLIVPGDVNGKPVKGADDFFAAGGTLDQLRAAATTTAPRIDQTDDAFTDARLAETIADDVLDGQFCWASGLGWMQWDGRRWSECTDIAVTEAVRQHCLARFEEAARALREDSSENAKAAVTGWRSMLGAGRERAVVGLVKGIVERNARDFDRHPDLLNTPSGVVELETGDLLPHDPSLFLTKITGAAYAPGATHPDWSKALEALPEAERAYMQARYGQAITGYMTPDDVTPVCQGGGENGKSTLNETIGQAIGGYYLLVSDRVLMANPDAHPTELMDFQGARLAVLEETPEARRLDPQRLKRVIGTPRITARRIRQDSVTFEATHSLFISTNHRPNVEESDHGTWRRLTLVRFPYRFRKPHERLEGPNDRHGDPGLRERCKADPRVHEAALAWLVEGARKWYAAGRTMPEPPESVRAATWEWRVESDLVLQFFDDQLAPDNNRHVMSTDLLTSLNDWLAARGHRAWSEKTLAARFGSHDEIATHRIEKRRMRRSPELSRRPGASSTWIIDKVPDMYTAWTGLRFREDGENAPTSANATAVQGVQAGPVNRQIALTEGYPEHPAHPAHNPAQGSTGTDCPECRRPVPAGEWGLCTACSTATHRHGVGGHGPLCASCRDHRRCVHCGAPARLVDGHGQPACWPSCPTDLPASGEAA
jgi:P4 family phage/plasmid primase-like protien